MKRKINSIIMLATVLLLSNQFARSQTWNLAGNTNMTNTSKIGGTSATAAQNFPLRLYTYNSERIHINANTAGKVGYVGIGTSAPSTRLHVNGVITATGGTSTAWNTAVTRVPAGTTSKVPRWDGTAYVAGNIFDNGTNVGIGTSAPSTKLHVISTGSNVATFDGGPSMFITLAESGTPKGYIGSFSGGSEDVDFGTYGNNSTGNVNFTIRDNPKMTISNGGNVGIGTTSPSSKLDINVSGTDANQGVNITNTAGGKTLGMNQGSLGKLNFTEPGVVDLVTMDFNTQHVGIFTTIPTYLLEVNGTAGKPGGGSWGATSDARLKQNVKQYNDGLSQLMKINPVTYHYNEASGYDTKPEYVGVLAQELKEVAPYMVGTFNKDGKEYYNVDNSAMIYMLINAVKEQQKQIETQAKENKELKALLNQVTNDMQSCCLNHAQGLNKSGAQDVAREIASLEQNNPNPADQTTIIRFYIPLNATNAVLKLMTDNGSELKSYSIAEKGSSQITVSTSTLASGNYLYQLIVDGKTIDTKRMTVTK